jgi:hypothetical protein
MSSILLVFSLLLVWIGLSGRWKNLASTLGIKSSSTTTTGGGGGGSSGFGYAGLTPGEQQDADRILAAFRSTYGFSPQVRWTDRSLPKPGVTDSYSGYSFVNPSQARIAGTDHASGFNSPRFADVLAFEIAHQANLKSGIEAPGEPENILITRKRANLIQSVALAQKAKRNG